MNWVFELNCRVKLLNLTQVLEFNFSTRLDTFSKKFQFNSTLFKSSTWLDVISLIFIDHLNLKYFMFIKKLTRWQVKWAEKLSEYNFKIIYQSKKQNLKVDAMIRMSDVKSVKANDDRKLYQHQMLLSEDKFELQSIETDQEDNQKADQDLTQILLRSDSESDSDLKLKSKVNQNWVEDVISIQNQIIVTNWMNQLCFNI